MFFPLFYNVFERRNNMKSFIEKKANLTNEEVNELLYYYQRGIDIGKEETKLSIINNLIKLNIDKETISKIINIDISKLEQIIY